MYSGSHTEKNMDAKRPGCIPTLWVTAIKLSFRSAKIIFRILAGNSF
ncbi:Uncharacterized protein dnm_004100 [Desulfonema magnum]|uniref:Uncharacterized protein n=1 Tax=Desulfonema magnum TaxID=45655 RepID=A0A975BFU1_9BACT|nr:Uncharacterized protein dnm_004100 [Desulfonema magnum]